MRPVTLTEEREIDEAMERYAAGDAAAFSEVHAVLYPRLLRYLRGLCHSGFKAADLVQETFLRIVRARATFARGAAVMPWALTIARNVHLDEARARRDRPIRHAEVTPEHDAEALFLAHETARMAMGVLARLPETQREAYVLVHCEGLALEDAAARLGVSVTAVKLRAFRAREALRAAIAPRMRPARRVASELAA